MTKEEAIDILLHHSFSHEDFDHPKSQNGFLRMLRPFNGTLNEDNFHELMAILQTLKDELASDYIDRRIISSFWGICHLTRMWAIDADGMLQRNNLIDADQVEKLEVWTDCINYALMMLLEGLSETDAFEPYRSYLQRKNR